ncbi:transglutaminase-like domain-containing protein [Nannocystis sp. ILAH1]|uniref:SirB1 family protein n=1 Tax=unclassified Nannocystis TaxID=2627009 RepID=UPI002270C77D|nr:MULTISPECIES: transglutaminase-like domain-containing protein [unclassified Nannocystis]MCY0993920.1 transglutaminase-like domain-containing protein [Nannocystis sp. ILAH1]MCY1066887.1 transglutaminase-like domain-containing protein [Nannocystis sp. RBIL2]
MDARQHHARQQFSRLAASPDHALDLGETALWIGAEEDGPVDVEDYLTRLDDLAATLRARLLPDHTARERLDQLLAFVFRELGFHGNESDYYDPRNSYFHQVLDRRCGLPISLALLLIELARRVGLRVAGVGFPAHFLAVDLDLPQLYIDPFHGGRLLTEYECRVMLRQKTQGRIEFDRNQLRPVGGRQLLVRMLNNLKSVHLSRGDLERALAASDRILLLSPGAAEEYRDRGLCQLQRRAYRAAAEDLNHYLSLAPMADDRQLIAARAAEARNKARLVN